MIEYWYCPNCQEELSPTRVTCQELCDTCGHPAEWIQGIAPDRLVEICQAEREGRCVVLPCKVGDTVYFTGRGSLEETKVRTFFVGHPSYNRGEPDPRYYMIRCTNFDVPMKDFDRTVFLAREAAEAALKKCNTPLTTTTAKNGG